MKIGTMVPFFTEIDIKTRLELMKKAGFDNLMFTLDRNHEKYTCKLEGMLEICKQVGLEISSSHAAYSEPEVVKFWSQGKEGDEIEAEYLKEIEFAAKHNLETVVFHLNFETNYTLGEVGLSRLRNMVKLAEKLGVKIAIENLYKRDELEYIFNNIQSKNLGMCYDSGHENFLTQNENYLEKFGNKLFALHLHDNDGKEDLHKMIFTGTVDWQKVAKDLAQANSVSLDGEIKLSRPQGKQKITEEEYFELMKKSYDSLKKLANMIESNKKV